MRVEVRDTSVADASAVVVAADTAPVGQRSEAGAEASGASGGAPLAELTLELPDAGAPEDWTIWAHIRNSDAPGMAVGDWITVQSYPVPSAPGGESVAGESMRYAEVEVVQI